MIDIKSLKSSVEKLIKAPHHEISIINLVDLLTEYAYSTRASDIHLDPVAEKIRIRLRIDGILHDAFLFPKELQSEIISRIKVLSGLRTDEHNLPQDGRFRAKIEGFGEIDVRVSIMPTYYGENAVLRILAERTRSSDLENLGLSAHDLKIIESALRKPYGMILANGPTGSGKTTSLYSFIKKLNQSEASIITIEDPIEYSLEGITQIQINPPSLTFANGLRSILRQDPNIIMVGEIRDEETADIAVNAALTGHLLLSTLHTNDSATTFPRLIDMKIPPFLVASTINVVIGQRLVRMVCQACKIERKLTASEIKSISEEIPGVAIAEKGFKVGKGCEACNGSGYQGRIGVFEVLAINDAIRNLILARADTSQIKAAAISSGMTSMVQDGLQKASQGLTTIEEVIRIIHE